MADQVDALPGDRIDPNADTDRALLEAWRDGDNPAGDQLTQAYFDRIRSYFVRRAPDEHEELVQKTFLGIVGAKDKWRGESTVRVYIYCIARNVLRRHLRDIRRNPPFDPLSSSLLEAYGRRPSSMLAEREQHQLLLDALQEIPSADQDLLELYYWEGLTGPELRAVFDITEGGVRSRLRRARTNLRSRYDELDEQPRAAQDEQIDRWLGELRP